MNENIDLTKILKDCPKGTKLYSTIFGEVEFEHIETDFRHQYVIIELKDLLLERITFDGKLYNCYDGECTFPFHQKNKEIGLNSLPLGARKKRFDPKTLKPFDKVLVRKFSISEWRCGIFSHHQFHWGVVFNDTYKFCIPYNDKTKHLVGTKKEAPEYYRYWED